MKFIDVVLRLMDPHESNSQAIRDAWNNDCEEFFIGLELSTSKEYNYRTDNIPGLPDDDEEPGSLTFQNFYNLAMNLSHGGIPDHEIQSRIEETALTANALEWNLFYRRILLRSLHRHLPMDAIRKELIHLTTE